MAKVCDDTSPEAGRVTLKMVISQVSNQMCSFVCAAASNDVVWGCMSSLSPSFGIVGSSLARYAGLTTANVSRKSTGVCPEFIFVVTEIAIDITCFIIAGDAAFSWNKGSIAASAGVGPLVDCAWKADQATCRMLLSSLDVFSETTRPSRWKIVFSLEIWWRQTMHIIWR